MKKKVIILMIGLFSGLLSSHEKSDYTITPFLNPQPILPDNYPYDADGILILSQTRFRVVNYQDFNVYATYCMMYSQTGDTTSRHSIGNITLNDSSLFYLNDSTYRSFGMNLVETPSFTWKLGGTVNDFVAPNSQYTTAKPLVNIDNFNLDIIDSTIYRSSGFTFSHPVIQADSIVYVFTSDTARVTRKVLGTASGVSFTAAEMQTLPTSDNGGFLIFIYNVMPTNLNGKKYYFQNNSVAAVTSFHVY